MNTLEDIKNEVAKEHGWIDYASVTCACQDFTLIDKICHRAQEEALKNAAEKATAITPAPKGRLAFSVAVNKDTITDPSNIVK